MIVVPTRHLVINLICCCPSYIILGLLKAGTNQALGVDIPVSIFGWLGGTSGYFNLVEPYMAALHIFLSGIVQAKEVQRSVKIAKVIFGCCVDFLLYHHLDIPIFSDNFFLGYLMAQMEFLEQLV